MRTLDEWIDLLKDRSKDGDIGEYFGRKDCAELLGLLEELRLYREAYKKCKAVFDEMERRNEPEPYKCPDCIDFPCGRKECDKNHEAKACKYFELW